MGKVTENKLTIIGKSGKKYEFNIYTLDTNFNPVGGVYIFIRLYKNQYSLIYCGKTEDLSTRFDNHHKADCIEDNNANRLCVMGVN